MGWTSPHELLVAGEVDLVARKPTSLWSNVLVLPGIDVIDHAKFDTEAKIAAALETISLRGRRLEGAVLMGAGLRKVDFTGARLTSALLFDADLREAKFQCGLIKLNRSAPVGPGENRCTEMQGVALGGARLQGALLDYSDLQGATLNGALLQDASLEGAKLQDASLDGADLRAARLDEAQLQSASLDSAQLQGASLDYAQLQGASLDHAQLQGASLDHTDLNGASLEWAQLQGASLDWAELQGASLDEAELQGASFEEAKLRGASLYKAQLQGAWLYRTNLQGADLNGANLGLASLDTISVWRSDPQFATVDSARIVYPRTDDGDWSTDTFLELKLSLESEIPEAIKRDRALKRIAILDPAKALPDEAAIAKAWAKLAWDPFASRSDYNVSLADALIKFGCNGDGNPYVIQGLLRRLREFEAWGTPQLTKLAKAFIDDTNCPGARGLSVEAKAILLEIRDQGEKAAIELP